MDELQFKKLCQITDKILLGHDTTMERIAIPWLHIIREHPVFLKQYQAIFSKSIIYKNIIQPFYLWSRNVAMWTRQIFRALKSNGEMWSSSNDLPNEVDLLFISHLTNEKYAGDQDDFYFGSLPYQLNEDGLSVAIVLINYTCFPSKELANKWASKGYPRLILSRSLGIYNDYKIFNSLVREASSIKSSAKVEKDVIYKCVCKFAAIEALSSGSMSALRIGNQITEITSILKPKVIISTFEGHAWERIAFACARKVNENIKCIGYQHAALTRLQYSITRSISKQFDPDYILAAGSVSARQLISRCKPSTQIYVLGSNRSVIPTNSLSSALNTGSIHKRKSILVLPEGLIDECEILFKFSFECAKSLPDVTFVWRLHPLITFDKLKKKSWLYKSIQSNIVLSEAELQNDISRCQWALYRGSTAILPAVISGLRPIYFHLPNEMTIDPLYEINGFREIITSCDQLSVTIRSAETRSVEEEDRSRQEAINYCKSISCELRPEILRSIASSL